MYETTVVGHLIEAATLLSMLVALAIPCYFEQRRNKKMAAVAVILPTGATRI